MPLPTPPAALDGGREILSAPLLAVDGAGRATAVWRSETNSADPAAVLYARRLPGGDWTPTAPLSQPAAPDESHANPAIALLPDGELAVAWTAFNGGGSAIGTRFRTIAPDGTLGPQIGLDDPLGIRALVSSPRGDLALVWQESVSTESHLFARVRAAGAADFGPVEQISYNLDGLFDTVKEFAARFDSQGRLVFAYVHTEPLVGGDAAQDRVRYRRRSTNGSLSASVPLSEVSNNTAQDAGDVGLAIDGQDVAHIAFTQIFTSPEGSKTVQTRKVDAAASVGPLADVRTGLPTSADVTLQIGVQPGGREAVAWTEPVDTRQVLRARVRPAGGDFAAMQTLSNVDLNSYAAEIGSYGEGGLMIPWRERSAPADLLRVAQLEPQENAFGPALTLASVPAVTASFAAVEAAGDAAGNLTLVAIQQNGVNTRGVVAVLGDNDGAPELTALSIPSTGAPEVPLSFSATASDWSGLSAIGWTFSDGASVPGAAVARAFAAAGSASATVTAADLAGQATAATGLLSIAAPAPAPAGPAPAPGPGPGGDAPPDSDIVGLASKVRRTKLRSIRGRASDDRRVARVDVALIKLDGGARAAARRCRILTSKGTLRRRSAPRGRCAATGFLRAILRGTTWTLRLKRRLPKGRYVVYSRATDSAGQRERTFSARDRNRVLVTVR